MQGTLYVVATPIGNLEDITLRALRILKEVDAIACEDTRSAKKILGKYDISALLIAYHQHSRTATYDRLLDILIQGKTVAVITDAGTPGISDPGNELVQEAVRGGHNVVSIPGPSAVTALLSISGHDVQEFCFKAFPPHKKGRLTFFRSVASSDISVVYYESPHRFLKNMQILLELAPEKRVVVGRELTKMFEEIVRGTVSEVFTYFVNNPEKVRGEFVVLVVAGYNKKE